MQRLWHRWHPELTCLSVVGACVCACIGIGLFLNPIVGLVGFMLLSFVILICALYAIGL